MTKLTMNFKLKMVAFICCGIALLSSCKKDHNDPVEAAPLLERVRTLSKNDTAFVEQRITLDSNKYGYVYSKSPSDVTVTSGQRNVQYALIGKNLLTTRSITLNGVSLYFNPAFVTETSVIF